MMWREARSQLLQKRQRPVLCFAGGDLTGFY
jgi:hypothetical protein